MPKPPYRFDYSGYHIGGPVILPKFNEGRNKLFFFWNQEFLPRTNPGNLERRTMPTELERRGDFSQSFNTNGQLIVVRDPATGQPFPGNVIPQNRIDANGQALLNLLPLPNATDPLRQYNYTFQSSFEQPRNDQVVRVDWNIAPTTTFYSRVNFGYEAFKGGWGFVLNNANWPQLPIAYEIHSYGVVNTLLHTFSPTLVGELTVGLNHGKQTVEPLTPGDFDRNIRGNAGLGGLPSFFPGANPEGIVPNVFFTNTTNVNGTGLSPSGVGLANMPTLGVEGRYPFFGENDIWNVSYNMTKVMGSHNFKAGVFVEHTTRPAARSSQFNGSFNFDNNTANPLNTGHPFANALIGSVNSYSEATLASGRAREVHERRVVHPGQLAHQAELHDRRRRPLLSHRADAEHRRSAGDLPAGAVQPGERAAADPAGDTADGRRGLNPLTGEILPAVKIGTFVPGSGNHVERHRGVRREGARLAADPGGAAHRLRVGRHGRRQDVDPRRLRRLPGSLQRRHRPAARRTVAARRYAERELHDDPRSAGDAAQPEPAATRATSTRTTSRRTRRTGRLACSAISAGASSATSPTSARSDAACCRRTTSTPCRTARTSSRPASIRRRAGRCRRTSCGRIAATATSW